MTIHFRPSYIDQNGLDRFKTEDPFANDNAKEPSPYDLDIEITTKTSETIVENTLVTIASCITCPCIDVTVHDCTYADCI